jgi:hypothetical protein
MDEAHSGGLAPFPPKWITDLRWQINRPGTRIGRERAGPLR